MNEKLNKLGFVFLLVLLLASLFLGVFKFRKEEIQGVGGREEKEIEKPVGERGAEKEAGKPVLWAGLDNLYFLNAQGVKDFCKEAEAWLVGKEVSKKEIEVYSFVDLEEEGGVVLNAVFYLVMKGGGTEEYVKVSYDFESKEYMFVFVDKLPVQKQKERTGKEILKEKERETRRNIVKETAEANLTYSEDDTVVKLGAVDIEGLDKLSFDGPQKENIIEKVTEFLEKNNEIRRKLEVLQLKKSVDFENLLLGFKEPRKDGAVISVKIYGVDKVVVNFAKNR